MLCTADGRLFLVLARPSVPPRYHRVYVHRLGAVLLSTKVVYQDPDETWTGVLACGAMREFEWQDSLAVTKKGSNEKTFRRYILVISSEESVSRN
jgi:hypothetical protein